jgi:uncharacterized repeat protein (TIGR02543 family)
MKKIIVFVAASLMMGMAASAFDGAGSESSPYLISDATALATLATDVNGGTAYEGLHFRLTADLDLQGVASWTPIGFGTNGNNSFKGYFHGGGHSISNLKASGATDVGLFGSISGATVDSLYLINVDVAGTGSRKGGLVATALAGSLISDCYVSGKVTGAGNNGGVVGDLRSTMTRCYANVNVSGADTQGGLVGIQDVGTATNSYSVGNVSGGSSIGGVSGYIRNGGSLAYCYSTGTLSGSNKGVGGIAGRINFSGLPLKNSIAINEQLSAVSDINRIHGTKDANKEPVLASNYALDSMKLNGAAATESDAASPNGASRSVADFRSLALFNTASIWDTEAWSIDAAANATKTWTIWEGKSYPYLQSQSAPIAPTVSSQTGGVLSYELRNAAAKVVIAKDGVVLTTETSVAAGANTVTISTLADGNEVVFTVYEAGKMPSYPVATTYIGGTSGGGGGTPDGSEANPYIINDATALATLATDVNGGTTYEGQHFRLTADLDLQGVANWTPIGFGTNGNNSFKGYFHGGGHSISNLKASGATDVGLFGSISGATIDSLYLINVEVSGTGARKGGLAGTALAGSVINSCYVSGSVSEAGNNGAIVGESYAAVSNCYSSAAVSGAATIGGLIGYHRNGATMINSYSTGSVSGTSGHIGGVAGYARNGGSITYCYSSGNVSGAGAANDGVGGVVGTVRDAGWAIQNNVAINPLVSATTTLEAASRVLGINNGATDLALKNNYAWAGVKVNGNTVEGGLADNKSGADKTDTELRSLALFSTASSWDTEAWSIDAAANATKTWTIWEGKSYPYLQLQSAPIAPTVGSQTGGVLSYELRNAAAKVVIAKDGVVLTTETSLAAGANTVAIPTLADGNEVVFTVYEAGKMPSYSVSVLYSVPGSGSDFNVSIHYSADSTEVRSIATGTKITEPNHLDNSCGTFRAWCTRDVASYSDVATYKFDFENTAITQNVDLYPAYTFDVSFDAQGGSDVASVRLVCGHPSVLAQPASPTRSGHSFDGWYTDAACTTPWNFTQTVAGATTLYAKWTIDNTPPAPDGTGDGSEANPYTVGSVATLTKLATDVNAGTSYEAMHFLLTADLNLQSIANWTPIGFGTNGNNSFKGSFHGGGHSISNMTASGATDVGFFGSISNATIENLYLINISVSGTGSRKGGLVATALSGSIIRSCYVSGRVSGAGNNGGIVGDIRGSGIRQCYADVNVDGVDTQGGIIGIQDLGAIATNNYSTGDVSGNNSIAGVCGYIRAGGSISYCYSTGMISGSNGVAGIVGRVNFEGVPISNNVAMNSLLMGGENIYRIHGTKNLEPALANKYAWDSMEVNDGPLVETNDSTPNGGDKTRVDFRSLAFFNTAGNWEAAAWSIDAAANASKVWTIWDGKSYPYLQTQSAPIAPTVGSQSGGVLSYELRNAAAKVVITKDGVVLQTETSRSAGANTVTISSLSDGNEVVFTVYEAGKMPSYPVTVLYGESSGGGGESEYNVTIHYSAESSETKVIATGTKITEPDHLDNGCGVFRAWCTRDIADYSDMFTYRFDFENTPITRNIDLYPIYTFDVAFDAQGGSDVTSARFVCGHPDVLVEPTSPVRSGYTFGGWYTDAACTTPWTFTTTVTGAMTLYAKWSGGSTAVGKVEAGALRVYPNPAQKELTVEYRKGTIKTVELYSLTGELLRTYAANAATFTLPVADLSSGTYIVKVGKSVVKFVKE